MKTLAILTTAFCLIAAPVLAQGEAGSGLRMSSEQERSLYETLVNKQVQPLPSGTSLEVGATVPRNVRLYSVPKRAEPRQVRRYRYTVANQRVVLVEPSSRQVVRVLGTAF